MYNWKFEGADGDAPPKESNTIKKVTAKRFTDSGSMDTVEGDDNIYFYAGVSMKENLLLYKEISRLDREMQMISMNLD